MTDLRSAPLPPLQADDHVRGGQAARLVIEYADFECHHCAVTQVKLGRLSLQCVFRHFPVRSKHPRAWACACAVEAAGRQGHFWELHDALFANQGRIEDPHLWEHARNLGLDIERFDDDRRSEEVAARVRRDFQSGIRAGVVATPTLFVDGEAHGGPPDAALLQRIAG